MAQHRRSMSGIRVTETGKWGRDKATERYGQLRFKDGAPPPPKDWQKPQQLGDPSFPNGHGLGYNNDSGDSWLRGRRESAERKPAFDRMESRKPQPRNPAQEGRGARR
jgi:hypothetical protein